jgi:hypothetical protein
VSETTIGSFPPDPNSPQSTISTVQREICETGGEATAIPVDVRDFESIKRLIDETLKVGTYNTSGGFFSHATRHTIAWMLSSTMLGPFGGALFSTPR